MIVLSDETEPPAFRKIRIQCDDGDIVVVQRRDVSFNGRIVEGAQGDALDFFIQQFIQQFDYLAGNICLAFFQNNLYVKILQLRPGRIDAP